MTTPVLPLTFRLLAICGCWRPACCSSSCKRVMYNIFSAFAVSLLYSVTCWEIIGILHVDNVDDLIENSYLPLSMIGGCCKMANLLIYRKRIAELVDVLTEDPHISTNTAETSIREKYDKIIRTNTMQYTIMIETSVISSILNSIMVDYKKKKLPYGDWLPYNYNSTVRFAVSYFYEMLGMVTSSYVHVAGDALICGLLIHTCCQIEILECRIKSITRRQQDILHKCAWHHDSIYRLAGTITATFQIMISSQFVLSALVLCVSMCQLLKKDIFSVEFLSLMLYLSTLLAQIFLYCWYANEVKLKSARVSEVIFQSDWTDLSDSFKRDLMFMMQRTAYPVEFNFLHMINVNLDSFMSLMKSSYSVYSILQRNQK